MEITKGDPNNKIFIKFSSTSLNEERDYIKDLISQTINKDTVGNKQKQIEAKWLTNYLNTCKCTRYFLNLADSVKHGATLSPSPPKIQ
jgi:hypothetical protein